MEISIWIFFSLCFSVVFKSHAAVTKCYYCFESLPDSCPNPLDTEDCKGDNDDDEFSCINDDTHGILHKGCVYKKEANSICENFTKNDGGKCYFCDFNLCNSNQTISETEDTDLHCYTCHQECDDELERESCYDMLYDVNFSCMHIDFQGDVTKKCVKTPEAHNICEDVKRKNGKCYFCDKPYCNKNPKVSETKAVSQCYFCDGECEKPLEIKKCGYKNACLHKESNGEITKKCIDPDDFSCPNEDNAKNGRCEICYTDLCNNDTNDTTGNNASTKIIFQMILQLIIFVLFE